MLPEVLRTAKDLAVVAAGQRTSVLHSRTGRPAVQPRSWGQPAGRSGALACWAQRSSRRSRHDDRVTLDVEVGVQACRRLHFDESRRAEGAQPSLIEPQASPDLEQICRRAPRLTLCLSSMPAGRGGGRDEAGAARARLRERCRCCRGREAHHLARVRPAARSTSRSWRPPRGTHAACG